MSLTALLCNNSNNSQYKDLLARRRSAYSDVHVEGTLRARHIRMLSACSCVSSGAKRQTSQTNKTGDGLHDAQCSHTATPDARSPNACRDILYSFSFDKRV